jgi:hypothetical protein
VRAAAAWERLRGRADMAALRWLSDYPGYLAANLLSLRLTPG